MRCKPDQICRIVRSDFPENINNLVRTIRIYAERTGGWHFWKVEALQSISVFDIKKPQPFCRVAAGTVLHALDETLEPLHDGDGVDETLVYAGKPRELTKSDKFFAGCPKPETVKS